MEKIVEKFEFNDYSYPGDEKSQEKDTIIIDVLDSKEYEKSFKEMKLLRIFQYPNVCRVEGYSEKFCIVDYDDIDTMSFSRTTYIFDSIKEFLFFCNNKKLENDLKNLEERKKSDKFSEIIKNKGEGGIILPHTTKNEKRKLAVASNNIYIYIYIYMWTATKGPI